MNKRRRFKQKRRRRARRLEARNLQTWGFTFTITNWLDFRKDEDAQFRKLGYVNDVAISS